MSISLYALAHWHDNEADKIRKQSPTHILETETMHRDSSLAIRRAVQEIVILRHVLQQIQVLTTKDERK
jgi:hypothetical protein